MDDARILGMLKEGKPISEVARALNVGEMRVALLAATVTRGTKDHETKPNQFNKITATVDTSKSRHDGANLWLGTTEKGDAVVWNPKEASNPHLMVVGESGSGKTYSILGLVSELSRRGFAATIIDYSQSYTLDMFPVKILSANKVREINIARNGISLNPLEIKKHDVKGPVSVAMRVAGTFRRIYTELGVHQQQMIVDMVEEAFRVHGITEGDQSSWSKPAPTLPDVIGQMKLIANDVEPPSARRAKQAETTSSHISSFFAYNAFRPDGTPFGWKSASERGEITVLQLNGMEGAAQKVVAEFLLWDAYNFAASQGPSPLATFLILDEAHNLSFKTGAPVDKIIREARKFGLGVILASQQPEDFKGSTVITNTSTKVFFKVSEMQGNMVTRLASSCKRPADEVRNILSTLQRGNAFIVSGTEGHRCSIPSHKDRGLQ